MKRNIKIGVYYERNGVDAKLPRYAVPRRRGGRRRDHTRSWIGKQENESPSTRCFRCEGYCGNNVSAGVPGVSHVSPSRERATRGALFSDGAEGRKKKGGEPLSGLSLGLMILTGSHCWLRPATWLANECRTMGGSPHEAAHGTCLHVYHRRRL